MNDWLLAVHAFATLSMTGVAWMVQLVHYPLFARVAPEGFGEFEREHQARIGPLVAPLILLEGATAVGIVVLAPPSVAPWAAWLGLALAVTLWWSTWRLQVPLHARLESGWDADAHRRLVSTSWLRTVAWTARGVLAAAWAVS